MLHIADDVTQALMELGSQICKPANPDCGICPLQEFCKGYAEARQFIWELLNPCTDIQFSAFQPSTTPLYCRIRLQTVRSNTLRYRDRQNPDCNDVPHEEREEGVESWRRVCMCRTVERWRGSKEMVVYKAPGERWMRYQAARGTRKLMELTRFTRRSLWTSHHACLSRFIPLRKAQCLPRSTVRLYQNHGWGRRRLADVKQRCGQYTPYLFSYQHDLSHSSPHTHIFWQWTSVYQIQDASTSSMAQWRRSRKGKCWDRCEEGMGGDLRIMG